MTALDELRGLWSTVRPRLRSSVSLNRGRSETVPNDRGRRRTRPQMRPAAADLDLPSDRRPRTAAPDLGYVAVVLPLAEHRLLTSAYRRRGGPSSRVGD